MTKPINPTLKTLLNTPGFHSSKPETWGAAPVTETIGSLIKKGIGMSKDKKSPIILPTGDEPPMQDLSFSDDGVNEVVELKTVADNFTQFFKSTPPQAFMLGEPMSITIKKRDGGYSKIPQIGGEKFIPSGAYNGKRGTIIFTFRPVHATEFVEMEMDEKIASLRLVGFATYIREAMDGGLTKELKSAKVKAAKEAERKKNESMAERYESIGFGTF